MGWAGKQHPIETLAEWCAPAVFAGAVAWSAKLGGVAQPISAVAGAAAFAIGQIAIRSIGRSERAGPPAFEPLPLEADGSEPEELLLDTPVEPGVEPSSELLLDDPLVDIGDDARVVRLFARQEPTPGEMVARIEDFLGDGGRRQTADPNARPIPDAGAALQAALANVRASLK